jgi:hypothetical protein
MEYFEFFDEEHYRKVRNARATGLSELTSNHNRSYRGEWTFTHVRDIEFNEVYKVERVFEQWYRGWYVAILVEKNGSHGIRYIENISCKDPSIIESIEEFKATNVFMKVV